MDRSFPQYSLTGVVSNDQDKAFQPFDANTYKGKWRVVFFWPKDFTFVCPTEIAAFGKLDKEFKARDAQLLGVSTDSEFVHHAWRSTQGRAQEPAVPDAVGHQARADAPRSASSTRTRALRSARPSSSIRKA